MKNIIIFILIIMFNFLFSQKKILLFSPETYQYDVQYKFIKNNKLKTIRVFYQHEFVKNEVLDSKLLLENINKHFPNKNETGFASLDWEGEGLRAVTLNNKNADFYLKQFINTIRIAKKARPNIKWSFFDLPVNSFITFNANESNEKLMPLYKELDYLSPSLYLYYDNKLMINNFYSNNTKSCLKIAKKYNKPVYPYIWHRFHPNNWKNSIKLIPNSIFDYYLKTIFNEQYQGKKISGVIWWHSEYYTYVNKKDDKKQNEAYKDVEDIDSYLKNVFDNYYKIIKTYLK